MGLRDWWSQQDSGVKLLVVLGGVFVALPAILAVLVVVAAVVGTFVLGMGSSAGAGGSVAPPQAQFSADYDAGAGALTLTHAGGDTLDAARVTVEVGDARTVAWSPGDGEIRAGDDLTVEDVDPGTTVRVRWEGEDGAGAVLFRTTAE